GYAIVFLFVFFCFYCTCCLCYWFVVFFFLVLSNFCAMLSVLCLQFSCFIELLGQATGSLFAVFSFYRAAGSSYRFLVCSFLVISNCWAMLSVPCLLFSRFIELLGHAASSYIMTETKLDKVKVIS